MNQYLIKRLRTLERPIAVLLTLLPAGALVFCYFVAEAIAQMFARGRVRDREMAIVLNELESLFRHGAAPVLGVIVLLAALNLTCSILRRARPQATLASAKS